MERDLDALVSDQSRRSILKKGAASIGALSVGAAGTAAAQNETDGDDGQGDDATGDDVFEEGYMKGAMSLGQTRPGSRFVVTSPVIDWRPDIAEIRDNVWSNYNTRVIRYLNSNERLLFWVAQEANLSGYDDQAGYVVDAEGDTADDGTPQPEVYQFHTEWTPFGDSEFVTVNFRPVGEDEEDDWLDLDDWWWDDDANGGVGTNATDGGS